MKIRVRLTLLVALVACTPAPGGTDPSPTSPTPKRESPAVLTGAFFVDIRTGKQTPLPNTMVEGSDSAMRIDAGHYYAVSPDGSRVYWEDPCRDCADGYDMAAVANNDGSGGRRLDPPGPINYYAGGWSPDGTKIVYQRRDAREEADFDFGELVIEDIDSGRTTSIDLELGRAIDGWWYLAPNFSADGSNVIYHLPRESSSGTTWDLWSVPVTGGEPTLLVKNAAQATTFDGPTYAFVRPMQSSFEGTRLELATPDGSRTVVDPSVAIFEPKISPDGSRIAYQGDDRIYVVEVATGETTEVAIGRMAAWFDDDTLIVAPDS